MDTVNKNGNKIKKKVSVAMIICFCFLVIYVLFLLIPLGWGIITSFKDYDSDFAYNIIGFPKKWEFVHYPNALKYFSYNVANNRTVYMGEMYLNSILYATGCAFMAAFIPCVVSYIVARFKFKFLNIIYVIVIACMAIPIIGSLPAQLKLATALGIKDKIWGMWIMAGHFLGMYFLVYYSAFKTIPYDYTEAAKIDGAGNLRIMLRIIFPLIKTVFFTIFLLRFIEYWNDYQTALLFIPNSPTISIGLYNFDRSNEPMLSTEPYRLTGCMLVFVPIFIVFLLFHDMLMSNVSMGGLKE